MATKREIEQKVYKRFIDAVDLIKNKGYSWNKATREVGMSKNTFRKMNEERGNLVSPVYGTNKQGKVVRTGYEVDERLAYVTQMPAIVLDTNGEPTTREADFDKYYASILGTYWNEIAKLEQGQNPDFSSLPDIVYDRNANAHILVKNVDDLILYLQMQTDAYMSEIWKQFHSEKRRAA